MTTAEPASAEPLTAQIVESLYTDALVLADEVRAAFDGTGPRSVADAVEPEVVALSIEGLRTTTRMMHMLAWILNQRAFMAGELNERQLRLHGALPKDRPADPAQFALLEERTQALVRETERLHARIARLDEAKRQEGGAADAPVQRLHSRLRSTFG